LLACGLAWPPPSAMGSLISDISSSDHGRAEGATTRECIDDADRDSRAVSGPRSSKKISIVSVTVCRSTSAFRRVLRDRCHKRPICRHFEHFGRRHGTRLNRAKGRGHAVYLHISATVTCRLHFLHQSCVRRWRGLVAYCFRVGIAVRPAVTAARTSCFATVGNADFLGFAERR
jgi:hypothetical protein